MRVVCRKKGSFILWAIERATQVPAITRKLPAKSCHNQYWLKEGFCWRRFLRRSSPCHLSSGAAMLVILFFLLFLLLLLLLLLWSDYACVTTVWRCGVHMCTCIHTYLLIYIHSNLPRNLHTKLLIYLPVYLHAYVHACIRAYDTQIHAYMVAQERYSFPILSGYYRHAPKTFSVPACKG